VILDAPREGAECIEMSRAPLTPSASPFYCVYLLFVPAPYGKSCCLPRPPDFPDSRRGGRHAANNRIEFLRRSGMVGRV